MTTDLLEKLEALKATDPGASVPAVAPTTPAVRGGNVKPNRYGGKCEKCTAWVDPGAGSFRKGPEGWITFHIECPPFKVGLDVTAEDIARESTNLGNLRHGIYTVVRDDEHCTFRISRQAEDSDFAPGRDILGFMDGSDNTRYVSIGFVNNLRSVKLFRKHVDHHPTTTDTSRARQYRYRYQCCSQCGATASGVASCFAPIYRLASSRR
jgi:hypothetical protein